MIDTKHIVTYNQDTDADGSPIESWSCVCGTGSDWYEDGDNDARMAGIWHPTEAARDSWRIASVDDCGMTYADGTRLNVVPDPSDPYGLTFIPAPRRRGWLSRILARGQ